MPNKKKALYDFFDHYYNQSGVETDTNNKKRIPMFTGARCEPVYPVLDAYARGVLLIYYPWTGCFIDDSKSESALKYSTIGSKTNLAVRK
jgi:hypothetical protein